MSRPGSPATPPHGETLTYFVDGMDCASCVQKVEKMVDTLPGTGAVKTSFTKQTLQLTLDESQTPRGTLEGNLRALGYTPALRGDADGQVQGAANTQGHTHEPRGANPWYTTNIGRLVLLTGSLLAAAYLLGFLAPAFAQSFYMVAALIGVAPFARKAWVGARLGDPFSINMLVTLAALGALLIGEAPEGAVVVFFFAIGELLEGVAAGRARQGIQALVALTPKTALLVHESHAHEVPADSLKVGQVVQVNPGARVPTDGTILTGTSDLDDSPVTGESIPVMKTVGDSVYAGSINAGGVLTVRVEKTAADNTIARMIHLVEEAEGSKAQAARFIDRFSRVYTPLVVLVAALVAVVPPLLFGQAWHEWLYKGLALLLIGCPCALVLSVPAAITSGISAGTRRGLLIKGGAALETIGSVSTIAFDKTGTLTAGKPRVTDVQPVNGTRQEVLRLSAAVESGSSHPLARAILKAAQDEQLSVPSAQDAQALAGQGVSASVEGRTLLVSSPRHAAGQFALNAEQATQIAAFEAQGKTAVILHDGQVPLGFLAIRDEPRDDARAALAELRALGISTVMLTGDNARTGQAIAQGLGIDVQAELLPEDKLRVIDQLKTRGAVAMVGDGINDAPALARSDVGIAMGGGTDVALETADAALLREKVTGVSELVQLSRATMNNIRQNIFFALSLKSVFLVTTLLGYTNLWMAILADTGATAIVTANALRLLGWGRHLKPRTADPQAASQAQVAR
ncbi:heavy metal translocating P-type ATPase [Deinococcus fonticola]|uniref:heavy metal translocating P-type ATPase n=1 Tax=Deinococcus fonticola TaxID=2528713 RepID=UPI0010753071|nr:heavy metal translocating P-type ATPase [Deinococcus fonticola]